MCMEIRVCVDVVCVLFCRMQCSFHKWRCVVDGRLGQRQQAAANDLYHMILKRRVWQG